MLQVRSELLTESIDPC